MQWGGCGVNLNVQFIYLMQKYFKSANKARQGIVSFPRWGFVRKLVCSLLLSHGGVGGHLRAAWSAVSNRTSENSPCRCALFPKEGVGILCANIGVH